MNIQDAGQLVFVFVLLVVRCKATFSNRSYKTSGFVFFRNLGCHSFLNPSITYLAHQIQRFKWGFPVTRHQSSVNFHILILNFPSITTRTILDVSSIWAQLKSYLRWYCAVVLPEVTWPEVTSVTCLVRKYCCACATGSCAISGLVGPVDRKWQSHVTGSMFCACLAFPRVFF